MDCGKPATVQLRGMCVHEHLTDEIYCDEHAEFLLDLQKDIGYQCYECHEPFGADPEPWHHHNCMLSPLVATPL